MIASNPAPNEPVHEGPTPDAAERSFMDDLAAPEPGHPPGGFSLASLFLLVTAAGVIALLARKIVETEIEVTVVTIHAIIGGFIGGIAGAIIGGGYPRPSVSGPLGWLAGTLTGAVCAATAASGGSPWLFVVGAVALVALGVASRWMHQT
ncbi:MAG TPA: hypothetical protein VG125_27095 [Pirellulales bacterium]|jgi:hypothetical protein|nr:hypothetical protein [Pirellulales bacterium]